MTPNEFHAMARAEPHHWWYRGMAAIAKEWLSRVPNPMGRFILDAGCGTGGNLLWLNELGRACGVDVHPTALELAAQAGATRLVRGDVQALPFAPERFDLVTSFDVLCHERVANDWDAFRELARVLRPGGWLLIRLPAYHWLRSAHDRAVHNQRRYTRREVEGKLRAAGLRPVRVSYANTLLFPLAATRRLVARAFGCPPASDLRALPRWLNKLLEGCLRLERLWLRNHCLPFGLSVLALAQKEPR